MSDYFFLPTTFYLNLEDSKMDTSLESKIYEEILYSNNLMSRKKHLVLNFRTQGNDKNTQFVEN